MTLQQLNTLIEQGEGQRLEFKSTFSKAVIETLVAFSNAQGGQVLIGVDNSRKVKGILEITSFPINVENDVP